MTDLDAITPPQDLSGIVGYRFLYTYANGWIYELYAKNATTIDYRIHTGHVGGRWVRDQQVDLVQLADGVFKISWTEPTGTSVVVNVLPGLRRIHGTIFFPQWIRLDGSKTALYQNEHLDQMRAHRDAGPTYPIYVVPEFAAIHLVEFMGLDNSDVIATGPENLPSDYIRRCN
jgi:phenolic acid decarboxylase